MNAQLKYADRRMSRVAVIQGSNERDAPGGPQVTIRDLKLGAELAKATKDRADYLELRNARSSPRPKPSWSSACARCWRGSEVDLPSNRDGPRWPPALVGRSLASATSKMDSSKPGNL